MVWGSCTWKSRFLKLMHAVLPCLEGDVPPWPSPSSQTFLPKTQQWKPSTRFHRHTRQADKGIVSFFLP